MITLEIIQKVWDMLQRPTTPQSQVEARELDNIRTVHGHPLITIDIYNRRHLLLPAPKNTELEQDMDSSGIHIITSEWRDADELKTFVDVVCLKPHLNSLFNMILLDILHMYPDYPDRPDNVCIVVLSRWRELLSREGDNLPDRTTLLGLWGELKLLLRLTHYNKNMIDVWLGPFGERYDFFIGTTALEVKTSTQRKGQIVSIHGHDQLEQPENGELYLSLIKAEETPVQGESISDLVSQLVLAGCNRLKLMKALNNLGLSAGLIPKCDGLRFKLTGWYIYQVNDRFPKIIPTSFESGYLPNGVVDIVYKIDLSTQPPYPLSEGMADQMLVQFANEVR